MIPSVQVFLMKEIWLILIRNGKIPQNKSAVDQNGLANGVIKYLIAPESRRTAPNSLLQFRFMVKIN